MFFALSSAAKERNVASIIKRTEDVAKACDEAFADILKMREDARDKLVAEKMAEKLFGRVRYPTRDDAIAALKQERDFFGNSWSMAGMIGYQTVSDLKLLKSMCNHAGVIRLDSKDFNLIRAYL